MPRHHVCLVCDYPYLSEPPRSEFGGGSFEICPACGFQFGVNDDDEGIEYDQWRKRWEEAGMPWSSFTIPRPHDWQPVAKFVKTPAAPSSGSAAASSKAKSTSSRPKKKASATKEAKTSSSTKKTKPATE